MVSELAEDFDRVVAQLLASGDEPFGFFCIVDRHRDRPQPA